MVNTQRSSRFLAWFFMVLWSGSPIAQSIDKVALVVNDQAITATEFKSLVRVQTIQAEGDLSVPQLGEPITEAIIDDALMLSHIAQIAPDATVSKAQIDSAITNLAAQNKITPQQLRSQLKAEKIDTQVFVDSIRNRLLIQNVISRPLSSRVKVSNSEIQEYISNRPELKAQVNNEYELYHLIIELADVDDEAGVARALNAAKQAKAELLSGVEFQTVLNQTRGATSGTKNGYLGWQSTKDLPGLFVSALDKLEPGQVSPALKSSNGFHLIKLVGQREKNRSVNEYQVRHILKRLQADQDAQSAVTQLLLLKDDLGNGANFADLAAAESDDRGSATAGGDLGWVSLDSLVPGFANAVAALTPNTISEPVRSQFGVHLIQVLGVREVQREFSPIEASARQQIFAEKVNSEIEDLLNDLRSVAVIEINN